MICTFQVGWTTVSYNAGTGEVTANYPDGTSTVFTVGLSDITNTLVAGNLIATHDDGLGNVTNIYETVTTLVENGDGTATYTGEDGTPVTITLGGISSDIGNDLTLGSDNLAYFSETTTPLVDNADGTFTYTNEDGIQTTIDLCNTSCPLPTVTAVGDALTVNCCDTIYGYLSINDTPCSTGVSIWKLVQGSEVNGQAIVGAGGDFQFTIADCTLASASFNYYIECEGGVTSVATFTVTITPGVADAVDDTFAQPSNTVLAATLDGNDTACSIGPTTYELNTQSINGIANVGDNGSFSFTPSLGFTGPTSFTYDILCCGIPVDTATANILVIQATPNDDFYTALRNVATGAIDATVNDTLCTAPAVTTLAWIGGPQPFANGTISGGATPDNFIYTSNPTFTGIDWAQYEIFCDGISFGTATIYMTVTAPLAADDFFAGATDTPLSDNVSGNDLGCGGGATVTYHLVSDPLADGAISEPTNKCINPGNEPDVTVTSWNQATGDFTITPTGGWEGDACFDYFVRCTDAFGGTIDSNIVTVQFTISKPTASITSGCPI